MAKTDEERRMLLDIIATHSPQPWSGINMLGEFDFSDEKLQDTIGVLPPKSRPRSFLRIGSRQIAEKTPFQQDIENPITDFEPLCN